MNDMEIDQLKARVAEGGVFWKNHDGVCVPVAEVNKNWVEFEDEPDLTEPAAILVGGGAVALYNEVASEFVVLSPAIPAVALRMTP